ncbi:MAG: ornithine carbamoyltransferase, partial [Enterococcus casseliflavus]|nr:ornithine carbamoyltransferase [Enterococcus casseliflavus]
AYCGDGRNNVANSLLVTSAILGVNIHVVTPKVLQPEATIIAQAQAYAKQSGAKILVTDDVDQGVLGADVVYTDVWVSMGEEEKFQERIEQLLPYQVNQSLMKKTQNDQVIFMHCLPAFHDDQTTYGKKAAQAYGISEMEVTDEVFRSKYARQFDQAENRLHSIKAIMAVTAGDLFIPKV